MLTEIVKNKVSLKNKTVTNYATKIAYLVIDTKGMAFDNLTHTVSPLILLVNRYYGLEYRYQQFWSGLAYCVTIGFEQQASI